MTFNSVFRIFYSPKSESQLALLPFYDFSGLKVGDLIPQLVVNRTRELEWKFKNLRSMPLVFSEAMDLPVFGVIIDGDALDVTAIINTALMFSGGLEKLPLSQTLNSLQLWLRQTKYIVRGDLRDTGNALSLQLTLFNREKQKVDKTWEILVDRNSDSKTISEVIDSVIYPLVFHFSKKVVAQKWEALKLFNEGLARPHAVVPGPAPGIRTAGG